MTEIISRLSTALADRYKIERRLGEGGMATVYLAHDVKHDRKVAIKVLRPELAAAFGSDRFLREIKVTARLNHPHILPLLDSGEADGLLFYVMPYAEGESLRDRLLREKQLPVGDALEIAREVADALGFAHSRGVVHRDIKPENILQEAGHAVVADFGVAQAIIGAGETRLTNTGIALGTPAYLSPEQASGERELDGRSDVYSLGCVVYEMLAGQPPFSGPTAESLVHQHLTAEPPPLNSIRSSIPDDVQGLVRRALAKAPADRFATPARFAEAIEAARLRTEPRPAVRHRRSSLVVSVLAFTGIATVLVIAVATRNRSPGTGVEPVYRQVTFAGNVLNASLSPDGDVVAFVAGQEGDSQHLMIKELSGGPARRLYSDQYVYNPQWSPDNAYLVFGADTAFRTQILPRLGSARPEVVPSDHVYATWSSDASRLVLWSAKRNYLSILDLKTRNKTDSLVLDIPLDWLLGVAWSPVRDQLVLAIVSEGKDGLWTMPVGSDALKPLLEDSARIRNPVWSRDGESVYYARSIDDRMAEIWRVEVREDGSQGSQPQRVIGPLPIFIRYGIQPPFSLSSDTSLLYVNQWSFSNIAVVELGRASEIVSVRELTTGTASRSTPRLSPDGRQVVFVQAGSRGSDLATMDLGDNSSRQITFLDGSTWSPAWSADGTRIAFGSNHQGVSNVWVVDLTEGSTRPYRTAEYEHANHIAWGTLPGIGYQIPGDEGLHFIDPDTEEERSLLSEDDTGWIYDTRPSPSGRWLAAVLAHPDETGLWLVAADGSTRTKLGSGYTPIGWTEDEQAVYAMLGARAFNLREIHVLPISGAEPIPYVTLPFAVKPWEVSISVDGKTIVAAVEEVRTDAWIVENFQRDR